MRETSVLAVSSAHPLAARDSVSMEDLADIPLLTIEGRPPDYGLEEHSRRTHRAGSRSRAGRR
ncbi:hypothetical protein ACFW5I_28750 [Streptomyces sp. NPDC058818]|uniref:hypothetical protein n=1 Tax=Streptomyces sp. NPDC058818 TaxID=3346640 RepID=UPI0036CFB359